MGPYNTRGPIALRWARADDPIGARLVEREKETGRAADRSNRVTVLIAGPASAALIAKHVRPRRAYGLRVAAVETAAATSIVTNLTQKSCQYFPASPEPFRPNCV